MRSLILLVAVLASWSHTADGQTRITRLDAPTVEAGIRQAVQTGDAPRFWVGYSVTRRMYADSRFGWWSDGSVQAPLGELLNGSPDVREAARRALQLQAEENTLVDKEIAVLLRFRGSALDGVRLVTLDSPARLDDERLYWLGLRPDDESLAWLLERWEGTSDADLREELTAAVGVHDAHQRTVPFLLAAAREDGNEDVRDAARYWAAYGLVSALGLQREVRRSDEEDQRRVKRSAIYALVNAREEQAVALLSDLVRNNGDLDVRREALLQLAHLDDGVGLPALAVLARSVNLDSYQR